MFENKCPPLYDGSPTHVAGKVYLIGAGPGDVELMTLKAVRALSVCDVVLIDELVNPQVLDFARHSAQVINVGKRGGHKHTPQEFIEEQMVELCLAGKCVARVKGGDPFVFGRGGEEIEALRAAGIPFEVISGVTAGTAVPAVLGIPLSHRDYAHTVVMVTGHTQKNGKQPNWPALVASGGTLVIYMGITRLKEIVEHLVSAGMPESTMAAAIENGTLPDQKDVVAPLGSLASRVADCGIKSPAIVVIGQVVSLASCVQDQFHLAAQTVHVQEVV